MSRFLPFFGWLCCLLLPILGQAQPAPYLFDLKAEKLDMPAGPWRVVQVLDVRPDRSRLGTVHRGLGNVLAPANFSQPLAPEVLAFVQQQPAVPTARPVVMRVFTLAIGEDLRAASETGEAELVADFLEAQPDSTYRVLLPVGEMMRKGGLDVTRRHGAHIAELLQRALRQLAAQPVEAPAAEVITKAQAWAGQGGAGMPRYPALQGTPAPRGLYRTVADFRNHKAEPGTRIFSITAPGHPSKREQATGEVRVEYLDPTSDYPKLPVRDMWGVSDGQRDYINYENHFYPLLPAADGRSVTFQGPLPFDPQKAGSMALGSIAGGMIGAALVAAQYSKDAVSATYEVHLATGRVLPSEDFGADAKGFATTPDSAVVYLYRRPDAAAKQPLTVLLDGRVVATLAPWQYVRLNWADRKQEMAIRLQRPDAPDTEHKFMPDFRAHTYLECSVPVGNSPLVVRPISIKEGQWQLKRMKSATAD